MQNRTTRNIRWQQLQHLHRHKKIVDSHLNATQNYHSSVVVITVGRAYKAFLVHSCMQTKLMVNTMKNDPLASFISQNC